MSTRTWCVAVLLVSSSGVAAGQTVLSEADALSRLSLDSPRLRAIQSSVDVARAEALAASRWPNPRVTVDREAAAGVTETIMTVLQPLPITGVRDLERRAASALATAAGRRSDDDIRRARAELRLAYADLVTAQTRERELMSTRDRLQALAEVLGKRVTAGDAAGFDRLRADREVLEIDADRAVAASDRGRAQGVLASFFGTAIGASGIVAAPPAAARAELPSVEALVSRADATRGELLALRQEGEAARLSVRAADRRWIPVPELVAGTKRSTALGGDLGSVFGVQAVLPLFNGGSAEQAVATARATQADARAAAFTVAIRAQIAALRAEVTERRSAAERYRASTGAGEIERIAQVSYEAGERGILELLDAYRVSGAARLRQAALDAAVRRAEIELEYVSGWELP